MRPKSKAPNQQAETSSHETPSELNRAEQLTSMRWLTEPMLYAHTMCISKPRQGKEAQALDHGVSRYLK